MNYPARQRDNEYAVTGNHVQSLFGAAGRGGIDTGRSWVSECLGPHLDRQGGAATAKGTTGTVDLAEEDHDVVWVRSCRL